MTYYYIFSSIVNFMGLLKKEMKRRFFNAMYSIPFGTRQHQKMLYTWRLISSGTKLKFKLKDLATIEFSYFFSKHK